MELLGVGSGGTRNRFGHFGGRVKQGLGRRGITARSGHTRLCGSRGCDKNAAWANSRPTHPAQLSGRSRIAQRRGRRGSRTMLKDAQSPNPSSPRRLSASLRLSAGKHDGGRSSQCRRCDHGGRGDSHACSRRRRRRRQLPRGRRVRQHVRRHDRRQLWRRRRGLGGNTCSTRSAAVAHILRPRHEGQNPRPLQEKATTGCPCTSHTQGARSLGRASRSRGIRQAPRARRGEARSRARRRRRRRVLSTRSNATTRWRYL